MLNTYALKAYRWAFSWLTAVSLLGVLGLGGGSYIGGGGGATSFPLLAPNGTVCGAPSYSFSGSTTTGMSFDGVSKLAFCVGATEVVDFSSAQIQSPLGTATAPGIASRATLADGFTFGLSTNSVSVLNNSSETARWLTGENRLLQGSADAVGYALNGRKSRGTVASPTVVSTNDNLLSTCGVGFVGPTNTFLPATCIRLYAVGTITDATTGIGGAINFQTAKQGVDTTPITRLQLDAFGHLISQAGTANTPTINTCTNGTLTGGTDNAFLVSFTGANSTCSINFGTTWTTTAPVCVMSEKTVTATTVGDITATTSLVTITPSAAYANTDTVNVICIGRL